MLPGRLSKGTYMLTAHANTTATDFIAQLRTFVIAMGCSQQVVDCVDNLTGRDDLQMEHETELEELESKTAEDMKIKIIESIKKMFEEHKTLEADQELRGMFIELVEEV